VVGVVLFGKGTPLLAKLHPFIRTHEWTKIFLRIEDDGIRQFFLLVFCHANLESYWQPFIWLTGKVLFLFK